MTSERLKRVTSKIEAAVERLSQLDPSTIGASDRPLFEDGDAAEERERQRSEIEDRDRRIAKLRADIDDISDLKDQEIERLRGELDARATPPAVDKDSVGKDEHDALRKRYDRLKAAAEKTKTRLDALIARMEKADG